MNRKWLWLLLPVILAVVLLIQGEPARRSVSGIRLGAGDDLGGILVRYLIEEKGVAGEWTGGEMEAYSLKDCCSSTTQWALSSDQVDGAVMCPDAARVLLEKDSRYEIVGPVVANGDMLVTRHLTPERIGVGQSRPRQDEAVESMLGNVAREHMLPAALPFAYEKGAVDGVALDSLRGMFLPGHKKTLSRNGEEQVTAVLVIRKSFRGDSRFTVFLQRLAEGSRELNQPERLLEILKKYKSWKLSREEVEEWNRLKIKFPYTMPGISG